MKILVINGPNLNMLGVREPEIYGKDSLQDIEDFTKNIIVNYGLKIDFEWFQSNAESEIAEKIQSVLGSEIGGVIINPGALSHTSIVLLDALGMLKIPVIEVHLSNTNKREEFRKVKMTAQSSTGVIEGLGKKVYYLAALALASK